MKYTTHFKRWITSILTLPFIILLIYKGGTFPFSIFIGVVCVLTMWEYNGIVFNASGKTPFGIMPILGLITCPIIIYAAYINSFSMILALINLNFIICGFFSLWYYKIDSSVLDIVTKQVQGIIYIPVLLSNLIFIRNGINGVIWIFFLLLIVVAGDVGAYYVGTYWGRHKLCPAVSPKKTIEGSIGGLAANLGVGVVFKYFFLPALRWDFCILLFMLIGIAGQIGDLYESELKRTAKLKDSGIILPGHGGILDRIDALLFAAPVAYLFKTYIF